MVKQLMMGNEAMALGAVEAGVEIVTAYPGTPSSEIVGTLAKMAPEYGFYVEWSTNEKVALEVAAGASYAGARSLVAMKQVGLNVASDALMSLAYIGVKGGLVLVLADDPGPHSSQTEQDTRVFGKFAKIPVFNPTTPQEAKEMVIAAFTLSEAEGMPVLVRPTTRVCHGCAGVTIDEGKLKKAGVKREHRFERDPKWIIFPKLSYERHQWLVAQEKKLAHDFSASPFNEVIRLEGDGRRGLAYRCGYRERLGLITSGVAHCYTMEALAHLISVEEASREEAAVRNYAVLKIGTTYPLPADLILDFAADVDRILVVEEQDPYLEEAVRNLLQQAERSNKVLGKETGDLPYAGEYSPDLLLKAIYRLSTSSAAQDSTALPRQKAETETAASLAKAETAEIPVRPPVFCAGCPHRASFYLFKEAAKGKDAVFTGDIGCYTLGNAPPLSALDTCLCMGAGVTIALGLAKAEPNRPHVGFVGDSTFFHSCLPGLVNAVYNQTKITLVVLDNSTTAMTGHQPHPGLGISATGEEAPAIDIATVCTALGVKYVRQVSPFDFEDFKKTALEAMEYPGPAVVVAKAPCVAVSKSGRKYYIDQALCQNCGLCLSKIGCPAIARNKTEAEQGGTAKPSIGHTCRGCGLCTLVCPCGAIKEVETV